MEQNAWESVKGVIIEETSRIRRTIIICGYFMCILLSLKLGCSCFSVYIGNKVWSLHIGTSSSAILEVRNTNIML